MSQTDPSLPLGRQERLREFTLLLAQLAAQHGITEAELAAAAGGACAIGRLLRHAMADEGVVRGHDAAPELLVMLFDSRLRQPVSVGDDPHAEAPLVMAAPAVSYQ